MADVIVETGSIVAGADSYISVVDATAYLISRGLGDVWDVVDDKDAALRKATDYMIQAYRSRWSGNRVSPNQKLDWPRAWVPVEDVSSDYGGYYYVAANVVPDEVKFACAELALQSNSATLNPNLERAQSSVKMGEIAITYDPLSSETPRYRAIDQMLGAYLCASGSMAKLVRA